MKAARDNRGLTIRQATLVVLASVAVVGCGSTASSVPPIAASPPAMTSGIGTQGPTGTAVPNDTTVPTASAIPSDQSPWVKLPDAGPVFAGSTIQAISAGGPGLVAVGGDVDGAMAWTSVDGRTWKRASRPPGPASASTADTVGPMVDVAVGGPGLVALGVTQGPLPTCTGDRPIVLVSTCSGVSGAVLWTSTDGTDWKIASVTPKLRGYTFGRLVRLGSGFVATGRSIAHPNRWVALTSADGSTWTVDLVPASRGQGWAGQVASTGTGFVSIDYDPDAGKNGLWTSTDGTAWRRAPDPKFGCCVSAVVAGPAGLMAVGGRPNGRAVVWTSSNGSSWSATPVPEAVGFGAVAPVPGGFVAAGDDGIWDSIDGRTWRHRVPTTGMGYGPIVVSPTFTMVVGTASEITLDQKPDLWIGPAQVTP